MKNIGRTKKEIIKNKGRPKEERRGRRKEDQWKRGKYRRTGG
jgi:hypothetical protein